MLEASLTVATYQAVLGICLGSEICKLHVFIRVLPGHFGAASHSLDCLLRLLTGNLIADETSIVITMSVKMVTIRDKCHTGMSRHYERSQTSHI
jgi:hypothetical protein